LDRVAVARAEMGAIDTFHSLTAAIRPDDAVGRSLALAATAAFDWLVLKMGHEYGHISSFSRFECGHFRIGYNGKADSEWKSATVRNVFKAVMHIDSSFVTVDLAEFEAIRQSLAGRPSDFHRAVASIEAGGLNQDQAVLSGYADRLLDGRFNPDDAVPYFLASMTTALYPASGWQSDLADYVDALRRGGIDTDARTIQALSLARLLSGSAWAAARGFAASYRDGTATRVEPLRLARIGGGDLLWPEVASPLSEFGPTLKLSVPVLGETWTVTASYQHVIAGGVSLGEWGVRASKTLHDRLTLHGTACVSTEGGSWLEAGVALKPVSWLSLDAAYVSGRGYTIHRDVNGATVDYLDENESGVKLGISTRIAF
jgi:hypothetical protein